MAKVQLMPNYNLYGRYSTYEWSNYSNIQWERSQNSSKLVMTVLSLNQRPESRIFLIVIGERGVNVYVCTY